MGVKNRLITARTGGACPLKERCLRPAVKSDDMIEAPFIITNGYFECALYMSENTKRIYDDLNDIVK